MNLPLELSQIVGAAAEVAPVAATRPRILIAGEFSSGKTCLVNGLLGEVLLPSSVTSTSLPPIWISHGEGAPECVGVDGRVQTFDTAEEMIAHVKAADLERIHHCRIPHSSPILLHFDLIDTPGSSDPNIPSLCWERMVDHADMIVWCSSSVQAWRQSEKSSWMAVPDEVAARSLLVLSHADRLLDPADREKVLRRVTREAEAFFDSIRLASFVSDADVSQLLEDLQAAAATVPRRASPDLALRGDGDTDEAAAGVTRIMPRRIRLRPESGEPLVLVTPAEPDEAEAALEEPATPVPESASHAELDDLLDLVTGLAGPAEAGEPPAPAAQPDGDEDGFLALLRGAIEAADEATDPEGPAEVTEAQALPDEPAEVDAPPPADEVPQPDAADDLMQAVAAVTRTRAPEPAAAPVPVPREAAAPAPMIFGPARMLWMQILPTLDTEDPDSLLDGIEQLVGELDLNWARASLAQAAPSSRRRGGTS